MKYILVFTFLIQSVFASEWDVYLKEGNKAYSEGNYEEAVVHYSKIIDNNIESGELFFNLGNAYYKLDEIGKSIYYYEKSLNFIEGDESLDQNIKIARLKIIDKIEPIPKLFLFVWLDNLMRILNIENWGWLSLILFFFVAVIFSLYLLITKRILFQFSWIFLILFSISIIVFVSRIYLFESYQFGIIFEKKIAVMSEPNLGASEVFILHEGTKIKINRKLNGWLEISIADGKTGWCKSNLIGII
ncbi:MAG: tetratricopeptide repeat protein [Calditrichia bacterium]|nr:tetratricopeptide repeat protein [Calditrichia bacterium]